MPDITKCEGTGCPIKEKCYRFTAKDSKHRQSYFEIPPYKDGKCGLFWGENQEGIWNQLKEIVNRKSTSSPSTQ